MTKSQVTYPGVLDMLFRHYGPYAFGLVMFLSMWFVAVKPELQRHENSAVEQREVLKQMSIVANTMQSTANTLERIEMMRGRDGK